VKKKINIAIDGYSSCGKSTLAKGLAQALDYAYIDSGAMYRAVTLFAMRHGIISGNSLNLEKLLESLDKIKIDFINQAGVNTTRLNGENVESEIRSMAVSSWVSEISKVPEVRQKLRELQQMASAEGGVVMDGRDIGSAVLPEAELKVFMTADTHTRARRRFAELVQKGVEIEFEKVRENLAHRDKLDTEREENPLIQVPDALLLDNTKLTEKEQLNQALTWAKERIKQAQAH
jgi:cytidylate kinase